MEDQVGSLFLTTYSWLAPIVALVGHSLANVPVQPPMQGCPLEEPCPAQRKTEGGKERAGLGRGARRRSKVQIGQAAKLGLGSVVWDCSALSWASRSPCRTRGVFPPAAGNVLG